ncbi:hypothetical protein AVO45_15540 [Ruegeria marisrubri]|uniref:MOSC domain-containing protein n=1 Tax=Ruegeria marisrubri TaxID=1685379 RepID=A0A0X3TBU3_9RHOB|nr:hypothetical protein [Ruegeria marisrubri]KUJ73153.1 hypothetical protein AVO45_15540 [Ruegeria marisrubri]
MTDFATRAELDALLPSISAAPKDEARAEVICYRPDFRQRVFAERISFCPERGVVGDRWRDKAWLRDAQGNPDRRIQVCILGARVYHAVCRRGPEIPHPGDTIIADLNLSEENLPTGSLLQAGSALLRVSDVFNDACVKWRTRYGADSVEWINDPRNKPLRLRGILCEIVEAGDLEVNGPIRKPG